MKFVVSLHDVHPSSLAAIARQKADLRSRGLKKFSLLVVPRWHGGEPIEEFPEFVATINRWRDEGDEVVLHGWTHHCLGLPESAAQWFWTRLYTNHEAEFLLTDVAETRSRLTAGRELFDKLGWDAVGFIAPAWLMGPPTIPLLRELGFAYTVTRKKIVPLSHSEMSLSSTTLCYSTRSFWRRGLSLIWNARLSQSLQRNPLLRLSLHPDDIAHPKIWEQVLALTENAVRNGRQSQTYRDCVADPFFAQPGDRS